MSLPISVVIITLNEESNIKRCLDSVRLFDEIIIVDSGSTDQTIDIAEKHGAKVIRHDWLGFGPQKQYAVNQASHDWVLSLDADEYLSSDLIENIQNARLDDQSSAFAINRRSFFLGKEVKYSGWSPDWVIRLFNRNNACFTDDLVHERVNGFSTLQQLDGLMFHNTYPTKEEIKNKTKKYGLLGQRHRKKKKNRYFSATWAFLRTYLIKAGFLDGIIGLKIASMNAKTTFIKYS